MTGLSLMTCDTSLILGQNGIWGDLPTVSEEGVARFGMLLGRYKQVRDDITATALHRGGPVGGNPEVYEKLHPATGRGAVCLFASARGTYTYITEAKVDPRLYATDGATVKIDAESRAVITVTFDKPSARIVYFGVE